MKTRYKIPQEPYIEVYINDNNGISILQEEDESVDVIVFYSRTRVEKLIQSLNALLEIATFEIVNEDEITSVRSEIRDELASLIRED